MKRLMLVSIVLTVLTGCGHRSPPDGAIARLPADYGRHIPGIEKMGLEELTKWVQTCAPYNASPEGRARNPYDPMDCDEVQFRHDSWRQPRSKVTPAALPALH